MQKWRPWEAASDTEWGLALERDRTTDRTGAAIHGCAGHIRHSVRLRSSASQCYVQRLLASSDWLIAQQWLPSDRPMSPLILSGV
jgi:hypothetical protein